MTQRDRILRALRRGRVNTTDFVAPTCDGGTPILRVAARVFDLQADGYLIRSERKLNGTVDYLLTFDPERQEAVGGTPTEAAARPDGLTGRSHPSGSLAFSATTPAVGARASAPERDDSTESSADGRSLFDADQFIERRETYRDQAA